ncbi:MAG: DUF4242 domain-containing protein [Chitinophagaceae bacterium]
MKHLSLTAAILLAVTLHHPLGAQTGHDHTGMTDTVKHLFIDVHQLEPGKVKFEDVAAAHQKDLAAEGRYGVRFMKFWVDEKNGLVYCLSSAADSAAVISTHREAHGLLPSQVYEVTDGDLALIKNKEHLFLDIHFPGAGQVTAAAVAAAHKKDLAVQSKYGVSFINYWVDEKNGVVMCLSEAKDAEAVMNTHQEAHGLLPAQVLKVKQGQ